MQRDYVVLERRAEHWIVADTVKATGDLQAIRVATASRAPAARSGEYVAIPARSWKPRTRVVETIERDRWADTPGAQEDPQ